MSPPPDPPIEAGEASSTTRPRFSHTGKRPFSAASLGDLTSHGVTKGTRPVAAPCGAVCGIIGSVQWGWTAQSLGFEPLWIATTDSESGSVAQQLWPEITVTTMAGLSGLLSTQPVAIVFTSVRLVRKSPLWTQPRLHWIVTTGGTGGSGLVLGGGWKSSTVEVSHESVHGVTNGLATVKLLGRMDYWLDGEPPTVATQTPRDVYSVVSDLERGRPVPKPTRLILPLPVVLPAGEGTGVYHGGGLLPREIGRPRFILPSTMSPTQWCVRRLSNVERLLADDVPQAVIDTIRPGSRGLLIPLLRPGKCWFSGVCALFLSQDLMNKGGTINSRRLWQSGGDGDEFEVEVHPRRGRSLDSGEGLGHRRMDRKGGWEEVDEGDEMEGREVDEDGRELEKVVEAMARCCVGDEDLSSTHKQARNREPPSNQPVAKRRRKVHWMDMEVDTTDRFTHSNGDGVTDSNGGNVKVGVTDSKGGTEKSNTRKRKSAEDDDAALDLVGTIKTAEITATKSDDAEVPVYMWNEILIHDLKTRPHGTADDWNRALDAIRMFGLRRWKSNVTRGFIKWLLKRRERWKGKPALRRQRLLGEEGVVKERWRWAEDGRKTYQTWWRWRRKHQEESIPAGIDAIERAARATWWEWTDGSAPFFWRWPASYLGTIRDGLPVWVKAAGLPNTKRPQRHERDEDVRRRMRGKLAKVRDRRYITRGYVKSLTSYFSVPKGIHDVRMVYDGTASGLNDRIWVPSFPLPTAETHLRALEPGYFMADVDIGEMFLNFVLHESLQAVAGVDLTRMFQDELGGEKVLWERWCRCAMGLKSSPYQAVHAVMIAEEVIRGDKDDKNNVFAWDVVRLNLPGKEGYDPTLPWVSKIRLQDGKVAADLFIYVDDARTTGSTFQESWKAARATASTFNYLGMQDAARKRRMPSREPGAWSGTVLSTSDDEVGVRVSQEKWDKAKDMIDKTWRELKSGLPLDRKTLLVRRGFLLYVTRTYPAMVPYMKGFHLTIDSWRQGRDREGWRLKPAKRRKLERRNVTEGEGYETDPEKDLDHEVEFSQVRDYTGQEEAPKTVEGVPRFGMDLLALKTLFDLPEPPKRIIRTKRRAEVVYGFGDASASGYGTTFEKSNEIRFMYGQWCEEVMEESSNFRELTNLVKTIKDLVEDGTLLETELFLFTDNSTAEAVYHKGNSSSRGLFEGVLELRKLEMHGQLKIHLIHVAGKRMVRQGTDGTSRGDHSEGVMRGESMLDHVPLHKGAHERNPDLVDWVSSWWPTQVAGELQVHEKAEDWYTTCHTPGSHLWVPPPSAADAAAEQLGKARHKRSNVTHLTLVPRLLMSRWGRLLRRQSDVLIEIPPGTDEVWPANMFEPLFLFISLPLCSVEPWRLYGTNYVEHFRSYLCGLRPGATKRRRNLLRKFFVTSSQLGSMPEGVVRKMLQSPDW